MNFNRLQSYYKNKVEPVYSSFERYFSSGLEWLGQKIDQVLEALKDIQSFLVRSIPNWNTRAQAHPSWIKYAIAALAVFVVVLLKNFIDPFAGTQFPFMLFYLAIVISAWYGGFRAGFFAALLAAVLVAYFYLRPQPEVYSALTSFIRVSLFMFEGILISALSQTLHRSLQSAEEEKKNYHYYATIARNISDAVITVTPHLHIRSFNQEAERMYGWKQDEVVGKQLMSVIPTEVAYEKKLLRQILWELGIWKGEVIQRRRNGSRIYIHTSVSPLHDEETNKMIGYVMVNRDITDRKKLEQGKDDFVALASHELKTPLTSLMLYMQLLERRYEQLGDRIARSYLDKAGEQSKKLLELVNYLLDVSRVQAGKIQFNKEVVLVEDFVTHVVRDLKRIIETHKIETDISCTYHVEIDKDRIRQVLVNLITNAVKYSPAGSKIIVRAYRKNTEINISVQDFGIGIPRDFFSSRSEEHS
ncbi:MAG: PAS domain S-box protein, partial [Candidatus Doudnabacteria bacterium]|nr:PAS domain S-box protein [Candidatus Doudnabacteria bacterium]